MRLLTLSCCLACAMSPLCRADDVPISATAPNSALHASEKLAKPISIKTRLRNGARVNGKVTSFDGEGFEGDASTGEGFSKTLWCDILPADLAALAAKILDEKQVDDLILKGELLMLLGEGSGSDAAFARALRTDKTAKPLIDAAKIRGENAFINAQHAERIALHTKMSAGIPTTAGGVPPWPILTRVEHEAATAAMKARVEEICKASGMQPVCVETRYFLLYAATKRDAVQECARSLDAMYEAVLKLFGIPSGLNLFWGKAVILLQPDEEKFRLVEAAGFNSMTPRGVVGLCHQVGPQVFVNIFWSDDQDRFDATLLHETVHGIMHRYHSAARLPAWADEGLCEYIASVSFKSSPVDKERRPQALDYIRSGGSVADVMRLNYQDGTWPGPNAIGYAVGYAIVELMVRQQADAFGRWIRAVKGGKNWEVALREDFGYTIDAFGQTATDYYRRKK
ncbi:MAG: hypothetical protein DWI10_10605 [Planctomycetota bacterium]|nr:MAG: hypothetical protein DWI10_10605 [Planctomycetota bacterium]